MDLGSKNVALGVIGNKAYKLVMNSETELESLVKTAKSLIVVKSVIVPVANLVSNMVQLLSTGVPLAQIVRSMPKKTAEVHAYTQNRIKEIKLEADLRVAEAKGDATLRRKLRAEIQTIRDGYKRLSIWPLIDAGEFTSISDSTLSRDDMMLTQGKLQEFIERQVNKLPKSVQNAGRYAVISKDTALFQGLQKSVEYGDFLAKAIMYDHLTMGKKKSKEYALGRISEAFVNYDRLPGRVRGKLENVGLLWFYNYKIRSVKIALSMIRENPLQVLLAGILPMPHIPGLAGVGTPVGDNLFSKGLDGTLGYSVGWGMGFRAPSLNPCAREAPLSNGSGTARSRCVGRRRPPRSGRRADARG